MFSKQKSLLIFVVVALCLALTLVNFHQFDSSTTRVDVDEIKSGDSASTSKKKNNKKSSRLSSASSTHHNHLHHHQPQKINESDFDQHHIGEGSFDHGESESLTKHDVQKFLLRYFGLLENTKDSSSRNIKTDDDRFFNNDDQEESANKGKDDEEQIKNDFCESRRKMVWKELQRFASPALLSALESQRRRHEAVASGKPFPNQKYLIWSQSGGLGNRFQSIVSTLVGAILSKRVFLMKDWFMPLPKSGVKQTPIIIPSPNTDHYFLENLAKILRVESGRPANHELLCPLFPMMSVREFVSKYPHEFFDSELDRDKILRQKRDPSSSSSSVSSVVDEILSMKPKFFGHPQHVKIDITHRHDRTLRRWNRMMCTNVSQDLDYYSDTHQLSPINHKDFFVSKAKSRLSSNNNKNNNNAGKKKISSSSDENKNGMPHEAHFFFPEKFVYIWTNQYFLPGFFANPHTAKQMKAMFPSNNPYSVLVRAIVMPSLPVVRNVRKFFEANADSLLHPGEYFGLQVRAFRDKEIIELGKYFEKCFNKHSSSSSNNNNNNNNKTPFFLATLHQAVRDHFAKKYGTGRVVTLAPARHEQATGSASQDQEALTDMFLLAFSKDLFVSPGSTFGSFVAAYAQTHPRVVNFGPSNLSSAKCDRAKFLEPCFASLIWYDKLMNGREGKLSCKLEKIPEGASGCVV